MAEGVEEGADCLFWLVAWSEEGQLVLVVVPTEVAAVQEEQEFGKEGVMMKRRTLCPHAGRPDSS